VTREYVSELRSYFYQGLLQFTEISPNFDFNSMRLGRCASHVRYGTVVYANVIRVTRVSACNDVLILTKITLLMSMSLFTLIRILIVYVVLTACVRPRVYLVVRN